ncbi:MAG: SGNH/GDSL hydrolase family protein [Proteobacteria bacterium]|nr:SGNH/GDSL hydrolase family protein [Pseudomonadota bacterium]
MRRRAFLGTLALVPITGTLAASAGMNVVFDGDGVAAGIGASPGRGLDAQVGAALGVQARVQNVAAGTRPVLNCLTMFGQRVAPLYIPEFRANIIVFQGGRQDIAQGRGPARAYAALTDYVAAAHRQGWKVIVLTELRPDDLSAARQADLEAYNDRVRHNRARADAVVDFDSEPRLADPVQRRKSELFNAGGVYPNDGGYALLTAMLVPAIKRLGSTA